MGILNCAIHRFLHRLATAQQAIFIRTQALQPHRAPGVQLPGGNSLKNVQMDEKAMGRTEAIILSMTPKERENPGIIGASRKKRIAMGAGVKVEDVNRLLKSFEQMRSMIKQFSGPGAGKKMKRMRGFGGFGGFPGF